MEQFEQAYMEEQILLLLDGELNTEQADQVWAQIEAFPEYKALYEEYASVYFEQEEAIPNIDFSYLEKGSAAELPPMKVKRSLKPVCEIAATDHGLAKSDKIHQTVQGPIQQLAIDSLERKLDLKKAPQMNKSKQAPKRYKDAELRLALQDNASTPSQRVAISSIYKDQVSGIAQVQSGALQEVPGRNSDYYASLPQPLKASEELELKESGGLLPDMIKAGQWIFGERKNTTTVEIAIGNNEKRSIKFKL